MKAELRTEGTAASRVAQRLTENIASVLAGKREAVELAVTVFLAGGHLLVEDVPGVGKTTLARALAKSVGLGYRRLQFTSDLMPADVLGGVVYNQAQNTFDFRPGPVFTNVLLADEINRTTPKTQSALLEAMGERSVSIDGTTHELDAPFFVIATQNPSEFYGTYPLPESQLDRFLVRMKIGYPPKDAERRVLLARRGNDPVGALEPVLTREEVLETQRAVDDVRVDAAVIDYLHHIILATRSAPTIQLGASTRAAIAFERAVRARALVQGRDFALPDDVKALAVPALAHRVRIEHAAQDAGNAAEAAERTLTELVRKVVVPV
ncbi:MAG: MoxR family ATPase [Polyangiales bacterium]|nr:MoxR family ATPase [Myxococcales bacterium]